MSLQERGNTVRNKLFQFFVCLQTSVLEQNSAARKQSLADCFATSTQRTFGSAALNTTHISNFYLTFCWLGQLWEMRDCLHDENAGHLLARRKPRHTVKRFSCKPHGSDFGRTPGEASCGTRCSPAPLPPLPGPDGDRDTCPQCPSLHPGAGR